VNYTGIDKIIHGVEDIERCMDFFNDWGLEKKSVEKKSVLYVTMDGSEILVCDNKDSSLPEPIEEGSTVRHIIWGVRNKTDLAKVNKKISNHQTYRELNGSPSCVDPNGLSISFRVTQREVVNVKGSVMNTWDKPNARIDQRSTVYEKARPVKIGHVVFFVSNLAETERFYVEVLGFVVSDSYPGAGTFLRCATPGGHHHLFLLQTPDKKVGLNHVAYTVRDVHEVFGGGLQIDRCGWKTQLGPGRHPISSAYFWYVENPAGGLAEYFTDEDYCTENWVAREHERSNEIFAEWAIDGGINFDTRRQYLPE